MDILEHIYKLRTARGWSEYELAIHSDLPQSTISSWYRKGMLPSIGSLEKICKGFGISVSQFFKEDGEAVVLTDEERKLLDNWNKLSPERKEALLTFLEKL